MDKKDIRGTYTFRSKVEILKSTASAFQTLYFEKPTNPDKEFEKLVYFKKFEPLNWIIGTGVYLDDEDLRLKKEIQKKYNTILTDLSYYLFSLKVHDMNGGKDFATVKILPNKPELINKKISDDKIDAKGRYYRKEYLKGIRENGEVFVKYWYKKPKDSTQGKKMSYFYYYEPWEWIIGEGFYYDNLEEQIVNSERNIEKEITDKLNYALLISIIFSILVIVIFLFFINDIAKTIDRYINKINNQRRNFQSIFENTTDGTILIKDGLIYDCNTSALAMFGYERKEEFIGRTPVSVSPKKQKGVLSNELGKKYLNICYTQGSATFYWKHRKKNGKLFDTEVTLSKILFEEDEIIHGTIKDISDKVQLQKQAEIKDKILIQQSKDAAMGEMIDAIAHQWKNPLGIIKLLGESIRLEYVKYDKPDIKEVIENSEKIEVQVTHLLNTLEEFRRFFRPEKRKIESINVSSLIDSVSILMKDELIKNTIEIKSTGDLDAKINVIPNEFKHVLINLISNSKDAFNENNITERIVLINSVKKENEITLEICDNAGGISDQIKDRIFESNFTTKKSSKGTGIGLYMTKQILDKIEADVRVYNKDQGVCFEITLGGS